MACGPGTGTGTAPTITVFAAASLRNPLAELADAYRAATGMSLEVTTDATSALRTQIELGARADAFLGADLVNPQALVDAGLAEGPPIVFASNALAIVVPTADPAGITSAFDLARPGVRVVAAGDRVPISVYAGQLIEQLSVQPGAPIGFAAAYAANVVSREDNVTAALAKVALGEGDAAIVYRTDAFHDDRVRVIELPAGVDVRASYGAVVPSGAKDGAAGRAFVAWLLEPPAQAILGHAGFGAPGTDNGEGSPRPSALASGSAAP